MGTQFARNCVLVYSWHNFDSIIKKMHEYSLECSDWLLTICDVSNELHHGLIFSSCHSNHLTVLRFYVIFCLIVCLIVLIIKHFKVTCWASIVAITHVFNFERISQHFILFSLIFHILDLVRDGNL